MGSNHGNGDIVVGGYKRDYYLGYEELIWVVILGEWVSYVLEEKIYVIEAIYDYECIHWECFGVFHRDQTSV